MSLRQAATAPSHVSWPAPPQLSDHELLARLSNDDARALEIILGRHWALVVDYVARMTGSTDAAEDIAQRSFCQLWDRRLVWRETGSLRALLCKVARNFAITEHRRELADIRSAVEFSDARATMAAADERLENEQLSRAVDREVARLPARRREIIVLRCVHDLSYREIADVMNIAEQTVANQLSKALATLRASLGSALG